MNVPSRYNKRLISLFTVFFFVLIFHLFSSQSLAATINWTGATNNNWSVATNWGTGVTPGTSDVATFTNNTPNATINALINVAGINIGSGYTGTVTQGVGIGVTVGTSYFRISGGTFVGSDAAIDINGNGGGGLNITGGSFTSTSGSMTVAGDISITGGVFAHNNGSITFDGSGTAAVVFDVTCSSPNGVVFNSFTISGSNNADLNINNGCTLPLGSNTINLTGGVGTFTMNGTLTTSTPGSTLTITGGSGGTKTAVFGSTAVISTNFTEISTTQALTFTSGSFVAPATITMTGTADNEILTCGGVTLNALTINKSGKTLTLADNCTVSNFTLTAGTFANAAYTLYVTGNFAQNASTTFGGSSLTVELSGSSNQGIGMTSSGTFSSIFKVNKSGGAATLNTNFTVTTEACTVTAGTFSLAGKTFTCAGGFTVANGGNLQLIGSVAPTTPTLNSGSTVTFTGDSSANTYTLPNWSYSNLTINSTNVGSTFNLNNNFTPAITTFTSGIITGTATSLTASGLITIGGATWNPGSLVVTANGGITCSSGTFSAGTATIDVNGNLTVSGCTMTAPAGTMTVSGNFAHPSGTFTANGGTVQLDGTSQSLTDYNTFYNLTKSVSLADTLTLGAGSTQVITNTVTFTGVGSSLLTLASSTPGTQWFFDPQGTRNISYVTVSDSNNINATAIDTAGNNVTDGLRNTNWTFDATAPTTTDNVDSSWHNGSVTVTLTCTDNIGGTGCANTYYTTDGSTPTTGSSSGTSFTLSAANTYTIKYFSKDVAGNSESVKTAANQVRIDTTAPSGGSISYTNGYSTSTSVSLTVSDGTDSGSGINTSTRTVQRKSATLSSGSCGSYGSFSTISVTGTYPNFTDTVSSGYCYQYQYLVNDSAGNTATYTSSNVLKVDTGAPSGLGSPSTTSPTNLTSQNWIWSAATDALSGVATYAWRVVTSLGAAVTSGTTALTSVTTNLTQGVYSFFVKATDTAGNDSGEVSGAVTVNTTVPTGSISISSGASYTTSRSVTLTISATDDTTSASDLVMKVSESASFSGASWEAYATSKSWTLSSSDGTKTVYVKFKDTEGNESSSYLDTIVLDSTTPSTPGTPSVSTSPTTDTTPSWSWTASTDSGSGLASTAYTVSWSQSSSFSSASSSTSTTNSFTHSTALADGTWYFRVKSSDTADNSSDWSSSGSVVVDTTAPTSLTISSPADGGYTNQERPAFTWKVATDSTSGLDSYSLTVDNGDSTSFTIDSIPVTGDSSTSTYTLTNDGTYMSLTTKSSSMWGSLNDGKLKEGTRTWTVKVTDKVGNSTQQSATLHADFTSPSLSGVSISPLEGTKDNYQVMVSTSPTFSGTTSDNLYPDKIEVNYYKENYFIGILVSKSLVLTQSYSLTSNSPNTDISFNVTSSQPIDYGDYQIDVAAVDKAGNRTTKTFPQVKIMTSQQAQVLLKSGKLTLNKEATDSASLKEETPLSLPALEKKAILRREMEAQNLSDLTNAINSIGGGIIRVIGQSIAQMFHSVIASIGFMVNQTIETLAYAKDVIFGGMGEFARELASIIPRSVKIVAQVIIVKPLEGINTVFEVFNNSMSASEENIKNQITNTQKPVGDLAKAILKIPAVLLSSTNQALIQSEEHAQTTLSSYQKKTNRSLDQSLVQLKIGTTLAIKSITDPAERGVNFVQRMTRGTEIAFSTFVAYTFDKNPTRITNVTIEELGKNYVIVSWQTNHYTNSNKVNFGQTLSYGQEAWGEDGAKNHKVKITNLKPGEKYFFEVMSQNKNYVYDAYYSFTTKK